MEKVQPDSILTKQKLKPAPNVDWEKHYENILGDLHDIENTVDELMKEKQNYKLNKDIDGLTEEEIQQKIDLNFGFIFGDDSSIIKCGVCNKIFSNTPSFITHTKSNKHKSNLKSKKRLFSSKKFSNFDDFYTPPSSEPSEQSELSELFEPSEINHFNELNNPNNFNEFSELFQQTQNGQNIELNTPVELYCNNQDNLVDCVSRIDLNSILFGFFLIFCRRSTKLCL